MKRPYSSMRADGNAPGLKVCSAACSDQFDPYRLPARQTEKISIRFPRPDVNIDGGLNAIITTGYGGYMVSTEDDDIIEP